VFRGRGRGCTKTPKSPVRMYADVIESNTWQF
jgi:hypothetical protein